ncbi:Maintenance of telomere capping protein 6 [Frankliniella fusca]|uniref:Maintenance of telomere capping protein 6 n=1 Tax=Frankliniella fusca TaxID=407009 RepID=A0AAE1LL62_9NEOP|nr:Maintenance of telomere capping protein 6 [Frankliniella fusca]
MIIKSGSKSCSFRNSVGLKNFVVNFNAENTSVETGLFWIILNRRSLDFCWALLRGAGMQGMTPDITRTSGSRDALVVVNGRDTSPSFRAFSSSGGSDCLKMV